MGDFYLADFGALDLAILLAVAGEAFDALFGFELEDFDLLAFDGVQNFGVDFDYFDDRSANSDVFAIDE